MVTFPGTFLLSTRRAAQFHIAQVLSWCVEVFLFMNTCYTANKLFSGQSYSGAERTNMYFWSFFEVGLRVSVFLGIPVIFGFFDNPFGNDVAGVRSVR